MPFVEIYDRSWQLFESPVDVPRCRRPGWMWLGCILFGVAVWTGVGFGIHALIDVL